VLLIPLKVSRKPKDFVSHVFALAAEQLARIGFQKRKTDIFTVALNEEVIGWLGMNKALYHEGVLQINPVVGVRHQELESHLSALLDQKPHQYIPASLSTNVGYLMPEEKYAAWSFQEGEDCKTLVTQMVATVDEFGRSFMEQNATLESIYNTLLNSKRGTPPDPLDYRIAVASVILGKRTEAESFVDKKLREIGGRSDEAAEWFRKFATKLRERGTVDVSPNDGKQT
jgi:hypothetical protein